MAPVNNYAMDSALLNRLTTRQRALVKGRQRTVGHAIQGDVADVLQNLADTDPEDTTLDQDERAALDQFQRDYEAPVVNDPIAALDDEEVEAIARLAGLRPLRPLKVSS